MCLSHRGRLVEAAYTLEDDAVDHGHFLEMISLLGKYDVCQEEPLTVSIENSKQIHHCDSG